MNLIEDLFLAWCLGNHILVSLISSWHPQLFQAHGQIMKCGLFGCPLLVFLFSVSFGFHFNIYASLSFTFSTAIPHSLLPHHLNPCQCRHKLWLWQPSGAYVSKMIPASDQSSFFNSWMCFLRPKNYRSKLCPWWEEWSVCQECVYLDGKEVGNCWGCALWKHCCYGRFGSIHH